MFLILDYGLGNLTSVKRACDRIGVESLISGNPEDIDKADKIILPGVGHFKNGMEQLRSGNFIPKLNEHLLAKGKPILGICLGMQLMTNFSEEGNCEGLGWVNAETKKIESAKRIPHMGWNTLETKKESSFISGLDKNSQFYFVHSYCVHCNEPQDIVATTAYGQEFVSVFQKNNIFGAQFHPEKSHNQGLQLLTNFISL